MKPIQFAREFNIVFAARFVRAEGLREHYKAILKNVKTGKCISIDYSPSPMHNPDSHMQERKHALENALCWLQHTAEALYWYERDTATANKYAAWLPEPVVLPYQGDNRELCRDARKYRTWLDNANAWSMLVNGIVETD